VEIDFDKLLGGAVEVPVNPREIFLTLDKSPDFKFLRDVQSDVLDGWFEHRAEQDSVIKLNVGSGKTAVGLLILQSSINEGVGPAVYICPDNLLLQQVEEEAERLGIEITNDANDPAFRSGTRILVANIYKLFNGKSVFGVGTQRIPIGAVVIDDAHACLATIADQFRITLPNTHAVYGWALQTFGDALKRQNSFGHLAITNADPQAYEEVPFWTVQEHADAFLKELYEHREDDELKFTLPFLAQVLSNSRVVIGGSHLEIAPLFPPTDLIESFRRADRRIYMTATLSDDSILVTHFGANPEKLTQAITAASLQAMGERMILMPQELNPDLTLEDVQALLAEAAEDYNVVVIVPSQKAADDWEAHADQTLIGESVAAGVARLRSEHVGLTVLINRYDGIDLPQDACRILAIAGLPEAASLIERTDATVLGDSLVGLRRQIQRIEQGMGRGIRGADDYCGVILFGAQLTSRLLSKEGQEMLTPATQAQLKLSKHLAAQMGGATIQDIRSVIDRCLQRDKGWVAASKQALLQAGKQQGLRIESGQVAARGAFDDARFGEHTRAADLLSRAANEANDDAYKAWLKVRLAEVTNFFDRAEAQRILQSAHRLNRSVLRPAAGVAYEKLHGSRGEQAIATQTFFRDRFLQGPERILFAESLTDALKFEPETADKFESAVRDLGKAIGLLSQRPEREFGEGPDNLWLLKNGRYLVIECKNGSTSTDGISKTDLGQLDQAMTWFRKRYGSDIQVSPVIIHPLRTLGPQATAPDGLRIIDAPKLDALRGAFVNFVKSIAPDPELANAGKIREALASHGLGDAILLDRFTVEPS
jgi:hypothetical protein